MDKLETEARAVLSTLTDKQVDVLELIVLHMTSKEIARELGIAPNTVDQRLKAARQKLGAIDRPSTARNYVKLKEICGLTTYGSSVLDFDPVALAALQSGQTEASRFSLADPRGSGFETLQTPMSGLEVLDLKYGRLGRIGLIVGLAVLLTVGILAFTAMAMVMSDLI